LGGDDDLNLRGDREECNTFAQWYLRNMSINLFPACIIPERIDGIDDPEGFQSAMQELYAFFQNLYEDMYNYPVKYSIPAEMYPDELRFNKKRLNAAGIVRNVILDFLYRIGQAGKCEANLLIMEPEAYEELVKEKSKKIDFPSFLDALRQLGLNIVVEENDIYVTSMKHPKMPQALSLLSKACARSGGKGLYHFQRCDFRVLGQKFQLDLNDVLQVLPEPFRKGLPETDQFLNKYKYKRKIEPYNDFGYRIIYSNKAGVVCYCLVNAYFDKSLYMYIRWVLNTEQTTKLFNIVDNESTEFADKIFDSICKCDPKCVPGFGALSPDECIARIKVERNGKTTYVCKDARWDKFSSVSQDFDYVRKVLKAISQVLYEAH
jgi:hypothetical protein